MSVSSSSRGAAPTHTPDYRPEADSHPTVDSIMTAVPSKPSTSRPRLRSEGMAPDGAAPVTGAQNLPGVSSQVGTQPPPTRALFAFTQVDGTGRSGPAAASPMGRPMVSAGDEVSASLLPGCATASDIGLCRRAGCPPQLRRGSRPSVAHGRDIDNFLSIGRSQASNQDPPRTCQHRRRGHPDPAARLMERPPAGPDPHQPPRPPRTRPGLMNTN